MSAQFPLSLTLFCLWIVVAACIALLPGKYHWRGAYGLMAALVPILVYLWRDLGLVVTLGAGLAAASVLRWPVRFAFRWVRDRLKGVRR